MKVVHVIQGFLEAGGMSVFIAELASQQAEAGHDVTIFYSTEASYPTNQKIRILQGSSLDELDFMPDIVHVHCLLAFFPVRSMKWCRSHGIPYVVSPHGCLMPRVFAKNPVKKGVFFELFLRRNLNAAQSIHCTGESEQEAVRGLGIKARTFVAPLGVHMPSQMAGQTSGSVKTMLFLSRISEEKGIECLLQAWKRVAHCNWRLIIAGPDWRGYQKGLERLIEEEDIPGVTFPGMVRGKEKDRLYRSANAFVLPSPMENFSMVVLDALAYGLPVICTQGTPWRKISERNCGWWVLPNSVEELEKALRSAMELNTEQWQSMSNAAVGLAGEFSWVRIAATVWSEYLRNLV